MEIPITPLQRINEFLIGQDVDRVNLQIMNSSPWIGFDVWIYLKGEYHFALWKETGKVYEVDRHGAAADEPVESFPDISVYQAGMRAFYG